MIARGLNRLTLAGALVVASARHARGVWWLLHRPAGSLFRAFVDKRPGLKGIALTPLISANWDAEKRLEALKNHFALVTQIGGLLAVMPDDFAEVLNLGGIIGGLNVTIDAPHWLLREGLLALSLWVGDTRIYSLSFLLGCEDQAMIAYVGGCQGVRLGDDGALYRRLTKAAHGVRPRDLLIEVFRSLCRAIGIERILAVSDRARHHQSRYSRTWIRHDPVVGDYDEIWTDRGGTLRPDGLFCVPVMARQRPVDEIPPKKRAMYAARYRMLANIDAAVRARAASTIAFRTHPHLGETSLREASGMSRNGVEPL